MKYFKSCALFPAFLFCFIFLFSYNNVFAQTDINGDIISTDTTWTKAAGPYVVYLSPVVQTGATLTIEPGTTIQFDTDQYIDILGKLIANGTVGEKIYFTSLIPGNYWGGIDVLDGGAYEISNAEISDADTALSTYLAGGSIDSAQIYNCRNGIYITESTADIKNSVFLDISSNVISAFSSSTTSFISSSIKNIGRYGFEISDGSYLNISDSTTENVGGPAIVEISSGSKSDMDGLNIKNNSVSSSDLIDVFDSSSATVANSTISNNNTNFAFNIYSDSYLSFSSSSISNSAKYYAFSLYDAWYNPGGISTLNIENSLLDGSGLGSGINIDGADNAYIKNTKILNFSDYPGGVTTGNNPYVEIINSEISGNDYGIMNFGGDVEITNSIMKNNIDDGIYNSSQTAYPSGVMEIPAILNISDSEISGNYYGLENDSGTVNITNSVIKDSGAFSIYNYVSAFPVNAVSNWWGDVSGPFNSTLNASGTTTSIVSNYVLFTPWLTAEPDFSPASTTSTTTDPTSTSTPKTPVIIVPGIMGSQLLKNYGDNSEIWPNIGELLISFSDSFLNDLSLLPNGSEDPNFPMTTGDIMRKIVVAGNTVLDSWGGMVDVLTTGGYMEGTDLFVFPYDWRKSNADDAILLKDKIDAVLAQTGASKVDIIVHSMGGLVAQKYVADNGADKIDKLFFIGTPHIGAPKAFKALMYGDDMGIGIGPSNIRVHVLNPSEVKTISQNMPGVFDLLPSPTYINQNKYIYDATASTSKWLSYDETKSFMTDRGVNDIMFPQAESLHTDTDSFNLSGADIYNFAGCGLTKTIGTITVKKKKSWTSLWQKIVDDYSLGYTNGDETVPLISSIGPFGDHNYYVKGATHAELPSSSGVPDTILSILLGTSTPIALNISTSSSFCDVTGKVVSTHSPVTMDIYDDAGNHTGPIASGDIEYGIPGVTYDIIDGSAFSFLPEGGSYRIVIKATDTGAYDFYVEDIGNNDIKTGESYWNEIPLTTLSANSEINISPTSTAYLIKMDEDGDGTFESDISPSSALSSSSASDLIAPQTTSSVSSDGIVSLLATDNDSEVLKTEYSFDRNIWSVYNMPFDASGKTVNYFSVDKAGNTEFPQSISVPAKIITPVPVIKQFGSRSRVIAIFSTSTLDDQSVVEKNSNLTQPTEEATVSTVQNNLGTQESQSPSIFRNLLSKNENKPPKISSSILKISNQGKNLPKETLSQDNNLVAAAADSGTDKKPLIIILTISSLGILVFITRKYMIKI